MEEQHIDYEKMLAEAKRLKLLNEIAAKEIFEKSDAFDKSLEEIKSKKSESEKKCKNCSGNCKK